MDLLLLAFVFGVPLFFAGMSYLATGELVFALMAFALGVIGFISLFCHENPWFRLAGTILGVVTSTGTALYLSAGVTYIMVSVLIGAIIGYAGARWGYWLLEVAGQIN